MRYRRARFRSRGRSGAGRALLIFPAIIFGAPMMAFGAFLELPPGLQILVGALVVAAVVFFLNRVRIRNQKKQRAKKEYARALVEFRWSTNMSPTQFERSCADYLNLRGWQAHTTKRSGDQGADVIARKGNLTVVLQCKKHIKPIGNKAVQEAYAARAYVGARVAAVVSNQPYTQGARGLAKRTNVLLLHFTDLRHLDAMLSADRVSAVSANPRL